MLSVSDVSVIHILDFCEARGEEETHKLIDSFASPLNPDIETFLKEKAIDFAKGKLSITYLVIENDNASLLGYFTLAHKALEIEEEGLSKTTKKRINRYGSYDPGKKVYSVSAFLLAQFGKNYALVKEDRIDGTVLMNVAMSTLAQIRYLIGGGIVYLDCENEEKLTKFYESENVGYRRFAERTSDMDGKNYLQYLKLF